MRFSWAAVFSIELHALVAAMFVLGPRVALPRPRSATAYAGGELVDVTLDDARGPGTSAGTRGTRGTPGPLSNVARSPSLRPRPAHIGTPPPAAARAGEALTSTRASDTIVRDANDGYAGGVTQEGATSLTPVDDPDARAWGVPGGFGNGGGGGGGGGNGGGADLSRPARLGGPKYWDCPFPREAEGIAYAVVRAQADVLPDGKAAAISVLDDPGNGFGREARPCAMKERYLPALDRHGHAVRATTLPFRVVFAR